jgi:hypothetical protein
MPATTLKGTCPWIVTVVCGFISGSVPYFVLTYLFFLYGFPLIGRRANNRFHEDFHGLIETAGSDPAVSMTQLNLLPRSH